MATKSVALAEALLASGNVPAAVRAAEQALAIADDEFVAVVAARAYGRAKRDDRVEALAGGLANRGQPLPAAYAKIVQGERLLERGRIPEAIASFAEGSRLADVWLARFDLGMAYVLAGRHAEALAELDACRKRRGEATAIFLDDLPTWRFTAALPYWTGRAQQGLGMTQGARASLEQFVRARAGATGDPMVDDARQRLSTLQPAE